jgi:hypothetical protein
MFARFLIAKSKVGARFGTLSKLAIWAVWILFSICVPHWRQSAKIQIEALSLPSDVELGEESFPEIDVLVVANKKDLDVCPLTIRSAIRHSLNPIKSISVVTPADDVRIFQTELSDLGLNLPIKVLNEDEVLSETDRQLIKSSFPTRYGWVLQQFLAVSMLAKSETHGTLLLNCDTVLTRTTHWLNGIGRQTLLASLEYHPPYYQLLHTVLQLPKTPTYTFITHHMLFQPALLREVLGITKSFSVSDFLKQVLSKADSNQGSPLCIEFEPYGQALWKNYRNRISLSKFSNLPLKRNSENLEFAARAIVSNEESQYKSISLHSYLV